MSLINQLSDRITVISGISIPSGIVLNIAEMASFININTVFTIIISLIAIASGILTIHKNMLSIREKKEHIKLRLLECEKERMQIEEMNSIVENNLAKFKKSLAIIEEEAKKPENLF